SRLCQKRSRSRVSRCWRWTPTRAAPPVRVQEGSKPASSWRIRHWSGVSLSPDMPLGLPCLEEPRPEVTGLSQVAFQARPELPDLPRRNEGEDVVRLGLTHELAGQIGPHLGIGILEPLAELVQRHVDIPQEVGTPLRIDQQLRGSGIQHAGSLANSSAPAPTSLRYYRN